MEDHESYLRRGRAGYEGATIDLEMDYSLVEEQECLGHED